MINMLLYMIYMLLNKQNLHRAGKQLQHDGAKVFKTANLPQRDPAWCCMPFAVLQHEYSNGGLKCLLINRVDCTCLPAMIVPTAVTHEAYFATDENKNRSKL